MHSSTFGAIVLSASAIVSTASAGIVVSSSKVVWDLQTAGAGLGQVEESFNGIAAGTYAGPITQSIGSVGSGMSWTAAAPGGLTVGSGLFSATAPVDLTFSFTPGVQAVAGNFLALNANQGSSPALFRVTLSDGTSYEGFAGGSASAAGFAGFFSTSGATISSLTVRVTPLTGGDLRPAVDSLYFGIPAPGVFAILGVAGFLGFGFRRR